jgi:hypothetical protein
VIAAWDRLDAHGLRGSIVACGSGVASTGLDRGCKSGRLEAGVGRRNLTAARRRWTGRMNLARPSPSASLRVMRVAQGYRAGAAALWALLAPFFLAALIHPGVMPGRGADGGVVMVICGADGPRLMSLADVPGPDGPEAPAPADRCDWAHARDAAAPAAPPSLLLPALLSAPPDALVAQRLPAAGAPRFARPPARASPVPV